MLPCPGAVIVWSGEQPMLDAYRIVPDGLYLGRGHGDLDDKTISTKHVLVSLVDGVVTIEDRGSHNGTYINRVRIVGAAQPALPAVIRCGRMIIVVVADVRAYEGAKITRRGQLVCAGSLGGACAILDRVALDEEHIALLGPMSVGRQLAHSYADTVGGERVVANLEMTRLVTLAEKLDGARPRTLILELTRPLTHPDQPELEEWLETDVRIVSVARGMDSFKFMPKELIARLVYRGIELPQYRFDEIPTMIADNRNVHASFIESALVHLKTMYEETLMRYIDAVGHAHPDRELRGSDLDDHIADDRAMHDCHVGRPR